MSRVRSSNLQLAGAPRAQILHGNIRRHLMLYLSTEIHRRTL